MDVNTYINGGSQNGHKKDTYGGQMTPKGTKRMVTNGCQKVAKGNQKIAKGTPKDDGDVDSCLGKTHKYLPKLMFFNEKVTCEKEPGNSQEAARVVNMF